MNNNMKNFVDYQDKKIREVADRIFDQDDSGNSTTMRLSHFKAIENMRKYDKLAYNKMLSLNEILKSAKKNKVTVTENELLNILTSLQ